MNPQPEISIRSKSLMFLGIVIMMFPAWSVMLMPWLPIYAGLLVAVLGVPLLIWSMRLQERELAARPMAEIPPAKPFLPTRDSWLTGLAWVSCLGITILPVIVVGLGLLLIPAGDNWPLVIGRLAYLFTAMAFIFVWIKRVGVEFPQRFQNVFPADVLQQISQYYNPPKEVPTLKQTLLACVPWLAVAIFAGMFVAGVIDLNNFQMKNAPRKLRGLAMIITWCQGNPNFTKSTMVIALIASVSMCTSTLWQAFKKKP